MSKKDKFSDPWVRTFTVTDPTRHSKGYTLYKVVSKVFPRNSIEAVTQVTVWKRYNDFKKLHKALHTMHQSLYLKGAFPPFAKARFFGRFDEQVIEERRQCALELLEFSGQHPPLFTSQVFVKFFEAGHDIDFTVEVEEEEQCLQPILQPIVTIATPTIIPDEPDSNIQQEEPLGGIWKYCVEDEVSNSSQNAVDDKDDEEEDDRTTFTDEDLSSSKAVFDLSEFDPLLDNSSKSEDLCNDWLLSACQSCGTSKDKTELDNWMAFPKPFEDFEVGLETTKEDIVEVCPIEPVYHNNSEAVLNCEVREFDPLASESPKHDTSYQETTPAPYILSAAKCVNAAQDAELTNNYVDAFTFYKTAVDILLHGVQGEQCSTQNEAVKRKILVYLKRAEEVYENHITQVESEEIVPVCVPDKSQDMSLRRPMSDLSKYRVIGILNKVLLALNTVTNSTCIIKVLRKNPCPLQRGTPNIAPQGINFMVQLYEVYETIDAIFLVLEYASGGRLWDYISSYMQRSPLNATDYGLPNPGPAENAANVYSGKKMSSDDISEIIPFIDDEVELNMEPLLDTDSSAANVPSTSYLTLFKNYLVSSKAGSTVSLAKCNVRLSTLHEDIDGSQNIEEGINTQNVCVSEPYLLESHFHKSCISKDSESQSSVLNCVDVNFASKNNVNIEESESPPAQNSQVLDTNQIKEEKKEFNFTEVFNRMDSTAFAYKPNHLPESCVVQWAAEMVLALSELHKLQIIWRDLMPENILLGSEGHILLTYKSQWNSVYHIPSDIAKRNLYSAPEVDSIFPVTEACDWWSLGAILFELLTGKKLVYCHPIGITSHTSLTIEDDISSEAADLLKKMLTFNDSERLGSGPNGVEDIKCHPFFKSVDWTLLKNY